MCPKFLAPVVQTVNSDIHWIKFDIYIVDNRICCHNTYPLDSDLFCRKHYISNVRTTEAWLGQPFFLTKQS